MANIAADVPLQSVNGPATGDLLVLSWGGTYGSCTTAVQRCQKQGLSVAHAHVRYLCPFPSNFEEVLRRYRHIPIVDDSQAPTGIISVRDILGYLTDRMDDAK